MSRLSKSSAWPLAAASAATLLLAACGGGGGTDASTGTLKLALTDAPACGYDNVYITVESVKVHQSASAGENDPGWYTITRPSLPARVDLLEFRNDRLPAELGQTVLPAGRYTQMRLILSPNSTQPYANAVKPTGGSETELKTPSAQQSGLKFNVDIMVEAGKLADFVLDFDPCKSVVKAGNSGNYNLKPVIAVLPRSIGSMAVSGYVANSTGYTNVSLQLNGQVVRSTVPNLNGFFALPYLPSSGTNFDLVVADPERGTRVVTAVPVSTTAVTEISTSTQPITLSASSSQNLSASAKAGNAIPDAMISVHQSIGVDREIELASRPVDSELGTTTFTLATAPVQVASYPLTQPQQWSTYNASTAQFTVRSSVPGTAIQSQLINLGSGPASISFSY